MAKKRAKSRKKAGRKPAPSAQALARTLRQATGYRTARQQNAAEIAEDYVELIGDLIHEKGEARSVDMASRLGVSHVTVAKTIQRLQREGLVHTEPYRSIFLTDQGHRLARTCRDRHQRVVDFLIAIGVSPETAETDAEGIEHHVSDRTLQAMRRFVARRTPKAKTKRRGLTRKA